MGEGGAERGGTGAREEVRGVGEEGEKGEKGEGGNAGRWLVAGGVAGLWLGCVLPVLRHGSIN